MGVYKTALICLNGHMVNDAMEDYPEQNEKFCSDCGAETIHQCRNCGTNIKGYYYVEGVLSLSVKEPPSYCHNCGKPYPWTQASIETYKEIVNMIDKLTKDEKKRLGSSIDDLISDTPRTQLAVMTIKSLAKKISAESWDIMKEIIIRIGTESAKKQLGL